MSESSSLWPSISRLGRLILKEEREILRDRRTLITLLLMPVLLYPLMNIIIQQFLLTGLKPAAPEYRIGFASQVELDQFTALFMISRSTNPNPAELAPRGPGAAPLEPKLTYLVQPVDELRPRLQAGFFDALIFLPTADPPKLDPRDETAMDVEIVVVEGRALGEATTAYVKRLLESAGKRLLQAKLRSLGIQQRVDPIAIKEVHVPSPDRPESSPLASGLPLVLILMTITGAVYPAIDLTAGERERGTLEALMAAPVPRLRLLLAKYVAVLTVSLLTALINLAAMTATIFLGDLGPLIFGDKPLSVAVLGQALAALVLFAAFFSALLLALASFARSFKEAQAYLIPLMLMALAPGLLSLFPWLKLTPELAAVPLLNIVLLARDLFRGEAGWGQTCLVLATTGFYTFGALAVAARIFGSESVLYGESLGWSEVGRRPQTNSSSVSVSAAALTTALVLPAFLLLNGLASRLAGDDLLAAFSGSGLVLASLLAGFPAAVVWFGRISPDSGLGLRRFAPAGAFGAALLGGSLWPFALLIQHLFKTPDFLTQSDDMRQRLEAVVESLQGIPLTLRLFLFAATPGICEELFFRGYLFAPLLRRGGPIRTVLTTGVIFGLFHVVSPHGLTLERGLPTTLLGFVLGWVRWRTGSVWPGMVLHCTYNGMLISAIDDPAGAIRLLGGNVPGASSWVWVAAGAGVAAGLALIATYCRPSPTEVAESGGAKDARASV